MEAQPPSRHRDLALVGVGVLIGVLGSRAVSRLVDGGRVADHLDACACNLCGVSWCMRFECERPSDSAVGTDVL